MHLNQLFRTGFLAIILGILLLCSSFTSVSASEESLEGGFLGLPIWVYIRWINPDFISGVIGGYSGGISLGQTDYIKPQILFQRPLLSLSPLRMWI